MFQQDYWVEPRSGLYHQNKQTCWKDQEKRWEDEVNEYLRPEESEETRGNDLKNNSTWKLQATKQRERKEKEEKFAKHRSNNNLGSDELKQENWEFCINPSPTGNFQELPWSTCSAIQETINNTVAHITEHEKEWINEMNMAKFTGWPRSSMSLPMSCRTSCVNVSCGWFWCWQDVVSDTILQRVSTPDTTSTPTSTSLQGGGTKTTWLRTNTSFRRGRRMRSLRNTARCQLWLSPTLSRTSRFSSRSWWATEKLTNRGIVNDRVATIFKLTICHSTRLWKPWIHISKACVLLSLPSVHHRCPAREMRRYPFSARCRQGWCQNWERCHRPQQLQMHSSCRNGARHFGGRRVPVWRPRGWDRWCGKGGGDGGGARGGGDGGGAIGLSIRSGEKRLRSPERPCGHVSAEKGTALSAIGGIRLVEEAAASKDAVMPRPGGTRPCCTTRGASSFPRAKASLGSQWHHSRGVDTFVGKKKNHQQVDPGSGVRPAPLLLRTESVLYYCVHHRVQLLGLGRPGAGSGVRPCRISSPPQAAKYVSERTVRHHVSLQESSQWRVTRTGVASTWRTCTVTTTTSTWLQHVTVCSSRLNLEMNWSVCVNKQFIEKSRTTFTFTCTTSEVWLVSSTLELVESRVRTGLCGRSCLDCAYNNHVSWMATVFLAFSLWLVSNKVTQLWLRTDTWQREWVFEFLVLVFFDCFPVYPCRLTAHAMRTHVDHISQVMSHLKHFVHLAAHISHVDSDPDTRRISSCVIMEKCRPRGEHNFHLVAEPSNTDYGMRHECGSVQSLARVCEGTQRCMPAIAWKE